MCRSHNQYGSVTVPAYNRAINQVSHRRRIDYDIIKILLAQATNLSKGGSANSSAGFRRIGV